MADCNLTPKTRAKSGALALDLAVPLALAVCATAILLALLAGAAPQPPTNGRRSSSSMLRPHIGEWS
jgi:hypothetical protein